MRVRSVKPSLLAAAIALTPVAWAGLSGLSVSAHAEPAGAAASGSDAVVARVGDHALTAREVERRIAQVPPFQLQTFGRTPDEIRRNFVDQILVRESLFAQGAAAQKIADRPEVQDRIRGVLRGAMLKQIEAEVAASGPVTDDEVRAYYDANREKYSAPPRVALWRILVATREEAAAALAEIKKDPTPQRWNEIARDKSLDKATSLRGGNLGFVAPDGTTAEPAVKVDPRVMEAISRAKDGEILGEPLPEGDRFAVVWRRQSMKAVSRTLDEEAASIRQILAHKRLEERVKALLAKLREQQLSGYAPDLVDLIDISPTGDLQPVHRPGTLPSNRRSGAALPSPAPRPGDLR